MECPKCHNMMTDEQKICEKCGWERHHFPDGVNTLDEIRKPVLPPKKSEPTPIKSDEDSLDLFIGSNKEKIKKGGFSFASFFFGAGYFLYRKFYLFVFLQYFINFCLQLILLVFKSQPFYPNNYIISGIIELVLYLSASICFAFFFKPCYLRFAQKRVEMIQSQNDTKDVCREKIIKAGGTNNIIICILLHIFLLGLYASVLVRVTMFFYFKSLFNFFK